ncbi:MAG: nicotinamide mononucleotide transporter [Oscillospiraceae bacterium]|nr:nicotinamide mononucleotide transporter [Oscillospiraceae bacterium]
MRAFKDLTKFELVLWLGSMFIVAASFLLSPSKDYLTLVASLIGVTALIFTAKGYVLGQILIVIFAVFYGVISFWFRYYGEMITYLGMSAPIAVMAVISWLRHPFEDTSEVQVNYLSRGKVALMLVLTAVVTTVFYFVLKALGNANLLFSTVSVTTSFMASYLTFMRSPYYALAYAANDAVLIALWILATIEDPSYFPMIVCFALFLLNDGYGFVNWQRMRIRQKEALS